jgi:secreted protein with Ig-like and vWFA domain
MSEQKPSQDFHFEYKFHVTFGEEHFLSKMERWAKRQPFPISFLLEGFVVWLEKIYYEYKVEKTMAEVDQQAESIRKQWEEDAAKYYEEPIITTEASEVQGLDTISVTHSWPGPDQWYQGPLEIFEELEERPEETRDETQKRT